MVRNSELEIIWKEVAMAQFEVLFQNFLGRTEENDEYPSVRTIGVPAEVRTEYKCGALTA
jgi:hypothetical protein